MYVIQPPMSPAVRRARQAEGDAKLRESRPVAPFRSSEAPRPMGVIDSVCEDAPCCGHSWCDLGGWFDGTYGYGEVLS